MLGRRGEMGYEEGELELEEGEAASGGGRELVIPDALTCIDERIQNVLGHLRKKFEGEITHMNLGSMYGCHGSFLPTYPRSPLGFPQYRNTADPKNHGSASRSLHVLTENAQKNHFVKTELDSSRKNEYCRISNESDGNQQMLNRAVIGSEQKARKIRIKLNSNKSLPRNTAAIYSGLGLDISPSSSAEDNLDETAGALVPEVLPDESPRAILEIMTSHYIPGGHLLSPLKENVLELKQKPKVMVKQEAPEFQVKVELHGDWGCTTSATLDNKDKCTKEIKSDEKKDKIPIFRSSKIRVNKPSAVNKGTKPLQDVLDDTGSNLLPTIVNTEHTVEEPAKFTGAISDKMKGSKDGASKGHISGKNKNIKEEPSLDHGFSRKNRCDSDEYNGKPHASSCQLQNIPNKTSPLERDKGKVLHMEDEPSQYKSKENGDLFSADSMAVMVGNVDRNSLGMMKGKKKVSSLQATLSGKFKFKAKKQLNDNIDRKKYGEDEHYALDHRIGLDNSYQIDKSVRLEKKTISSGEIDNKSDVGNDGGVNISAMFDEKSDVLPLASASLPAPEPILINEQWVCCDKCENWRLLPYGMNPDILPKKWRCSMQSWLPGMNSCKITEDETTKALRALYMVPAPENNIKDGGHDNAMSGKGTAIAPTFQGNTQSISSLGKLKGSLDGANVANTLESAGMSKPSKNLHAPSSRNFSKLKEKRKLVESSDKGEIVGKDQSRRMRSSVGVDHDNLRASKKMKKESNGPVMKHQPSEFEISKSSPASETLKNIQKRSCISPGMGKYGLSSSGKHSHGEDKDFSAVVIKTSDTENSGPRDSSIKKRKLKQRQSSQHFRDPHCSNNDTNGITKQNITEINAVKKKSRSELNLLKTDRIATDSRGTVGGVDDRISTDKECLSEQLQENTHFQHPSLVEGTTKREIRHAQTPIAATSSSSKMSNSNKYIAHFQETRASPVESVSSSPLRSSDKNPLGRHRSSSWTITENVHSQESGKINSSCSNRNYDLGSDCDKAKARISGCFNGDVSHHVQKDRDFLKDKQDVMNACLINKGSGFGARNFQLSPEHKVNPDVLSSHDNDGHKQPTVRQNGKTQPHFGSNQGDHANLTYGHIKPGKGNIPNKDQKTNPSAVKASKQQPSLNNASNGDASYKARQIEKAVIENLDTRKHITLNGDASNLTSASVLLKEARDLKHLSKRLKEKGDDFESTSMCFEAGLKFLHVASLWETPNIDSSNQGVSIQAMKLYSETGILFGFCAHEFERLKKMANAALAYKCVEVAYMKAAFFRSPGVIKDRHALHAASLMVAPDIDNLNNQSTVAKAVSARGVYSPQIASNSISRNNHHLMGLLSYAEDTNNSFEGTRKSQTSFSAYLSGIGKNQVDEVALVRKVLDFSFHNVKGLLQLIRHSLESINHESGK
ncbi:CW-type Zinc Finger [Zea mays]|uniref:CW-type Zinc Finger n=1 Tax=Zea mays TaxID=4577 RepID=A0A1D6FRE2_MAIZE|nr:CW-type Zinc Finger [Zea mays]